MVCCALTLFVVMTLQLAKAVDVVGSREVTPIPEGEPTHWVSPGQVQAELEELSRASRKFLEVSEICAEQFKALEVQLI